MFRIVDVADETRKIMGVCDEEKLFRWCSDAVMLITNKLDVELLKGYLDICTAGCHCTAAAPCQNHGSCGRHCITMPREVQTVIAVNIGGQPTLGKDQLFSFHLNGPGDCKTGCDFGWADRGAMHVTYRDLLQPRKLVAYLQHPSDNGKTLTVFGYDSAGNVLRRFEGGVWVDGYRVPMVYGYAIPDVGAPLVARITGLFKDPTVGSVRLSTIDDSGATGTLLSVLEPDETLPQYRRIQLSRGCGWARIAFLKTNPVFKSVYDHVPLMSRLAFIMAFQAVKCYRDLQVGEGHAFEADAARMEIESQSKLEAPLFHPVQVVDLSNPKDKGDLDIV